MSCCPTCPDDFSVKNIPDEVECLVSNKVSSANGSLVLTDDSGKVKLDASDNVMLDASNSNIRLVTDLIVGKLGSTEATDASLAAIGAGGLTLTIDGNNAKKGQLFVSTSGTIWCSMKDY